MILVSVKNGQKITLDSKNIKIKPTPTQLFLPANFDEEASQMSADDHADSDLVSDQVATTDSSQKRKRQRLTNLTAEEKLQRRKLKNRVAAQSARDRKKNKFDYLEENVQLLKDQNEQLRIENKLLKEKTQLLIEENRKLLEFKKLSLATFKSDNAKQSEKVSLDNTSLKRKLLNDKEYDLVEVKSAVFNNVFSQPQGQLQSNIIQKLIKVLIVYTMSLIAQTASVNNQMSYQHHQQQQEQEVSIKGYSQKLIRLKRTLIKLVKLSKAIQHRGILPINQTLYLNGHGQMVNKRLLQMLMLILVRMKH